jgi:hypothetical protein
MGLFNDNITEKLSVDLILSHSNFVRSIDDYQNRKPVIVGINDNFNNYCLEGKLHRLIAEDMVDFIEEQNMSVFKFYYSSDSFGHFWCHEFLFHDILTNKYYSCLFNEDKKISSVEEIDRMTSYIHETQSSGVKHVFYYSSNPKFDCTGLIEYFKFNKLLK